MNEQTIRDEHTKKLMARCQSGCCTIEGANNLLFECYGHIGWLSNELRKAQNVITLGQAMDKKREESS